MNKHKSEIRDGMRIDWNAPITMNDGIVLRADVFRPMTAGKFPVILSYGPYGKGVAFQDSRPFAWERLLKRNPEVAEGSTTKYQNWEVVDPEKWIPDGYVVVRVDSRGTGLSPGYVDPWSPRETRDLCDCIEWAAAQDWSNGRIGLNGISYFAMNAWQAAALQPPHLAAVCAWEGATDHYRDLCYHGGIFCEFISNWYPRAVVPMQHGVGDCGLRSRVTGELATGPETFPAEALAKNRSDIVAGALEHPLDDAYHKERSAELEKITVPILSAANWGGQGLHLRGNFEVFMRVASKQKWLEAHGDTHWTEFYSNRGLKLQKQFFAHFLKGEDNGWDKRPPVQLLVRHPGEKFISRSETEWPLARTRWTKFYLDPQAYRLTRVAPIADCVLDYQPMSDTITFTTEPLEEAIEITGPLAARLYVSSAGTDADLFLVLRVFAPDGGEVTFQGAQDPHTPVAQGWLRASHRKLDRKQSLPYRPYHAHDEVQPLTPRQPVELDVEIWPTCIVVPKGYRIALSIGGKDYQYGGPLPAAPHVPYPLTGVGPFFHSNPQDRPRAVFEAEVSLHFVPERQPWLLLPIIPDAR